MFHWGVCRCFSDSFIISILSWGVGDTVRYPQLLLKTQCSGCFLHQSSESEFLTYVCRLRARSFVWHKNPSTLCVFCTPRPNRKTACGSCGFTFLFSVLAYWLSPSGPSGPSGRSGPIFLLWLLGQLGIKVVKFIKFLEGRSGRLTSAVLRKRGAGRGKMGENRWFLKFFTFKICNIFLHFIYICGNIGSVSRYVLFFYSA